jgi:pilus assembly protein CpaB
LVYRGTPENTNKFTDMQEEIIEKLYSEEEEEIDEKVLEEGIAEETREGEVE